MLRKALACAGGAVHRLMLHPGRTIARRSSSSASQTVNSMILRSLKDHYLEVSKMNPPPKICPPSPYTVIKGALDSGGPVLKGTFQNEEIDISVLRMADIITGGTEDDYGNDINQLFLHIVISKQGQQDSLHVLCGLYPDALGIHSVSLRTKGETPGFLELQTKYTGPVFEDIDERIRDALHGYIEERGITEKLFPFLQAWVYVKDHRNLLRWFKTVGLFVNESNQDTLKA